MALTKILNDENKSFQPVLTDKLVYDTKPTVNSFNGITSDAVARAIAGASGEVPQVTSGDNGKILTAIYDEGGAAVEWADAPSGIPDMTNQNGKILGAVDNGGTMEAQWISKSVSNVVAGENNSIVVNGTTNLKYKITSNGPMGFGNLEYVDYYYDSANSQLFLKFANPNNVSLSPRGNPSAQATLTVSPAVTVEWSDAVPEIPVPLIYGIGYAPNDGVITGSNFPIYSFWTGSDVVNSRDVSVTPYTATFSGSGTFLGENLNSSHFGEYVAIFFVNIKTEEQVATITAAASNGAFTLNWPTGYTGQNSDLVCASAPTSADNGKVLTVTDTSGTLGWVAPNNDYTMVYNTTPAGGSMDGTPWQAFRAGKRIGCVVPYTAFSGTLAAGSIMDMCNIYMPLASVVNSSSLVFKWNFYLYDGYNKWSLVLTCDEDEWSWGTPNVVPG